MKINNDDVDELKIKSSEQREQDINYSSEEMPIIESQEQEALNNDANNSPLQYVDNTSGMANTLSIISKGGGYEINLASKYDKMDELLGCAHWVKKNILEDSSPKNKQPLGVA